MAEKDDAIVLNQLRESVEAHPQDPSHIFNLAKFLWERGDSWKEEAAQHMLMTAKLNPHNGEAFRYLGHYYSNVDTQRAIKCYHRAVSIDPNDSDSGEALCNLLDKEGKESLEVAVCKEASVKSPRAFWAFCRLGFLLVHQKNWVQAVQSLQHAIRGYPTSADLWEALGLAYQLLGMYTAAIKSYGRAMELESTRAFAMIESGNIFLMLGLYGKGIEQFRLALEICPHNVSAHYGLASGLLAMSKDSINQGAFTWATSLLEEASEIAKSSTVLGGHMSCVWKLYADIQIMYAKYYPWSEGGCHKDEATFSQSIISWRKTRYSAAMRANYYYQRALHLAPWQANIYMDISMVFDVIRSLEGSLKDDPGVWQLPQKMMLGSLSLEVDNHNFWMALGCLSDHKALRQHAFIRALQLDVSLASAWAYLGKLYREVGQSQLGRQAFDRARSIDPSLALPWAGMSADIFTREGSSDEAYESCLRAASIMPIAEFQIGLAKLALVSGHLSSSAVFSSIRQAVQCAPCYPESHILNGFVFEARHDHESAVSSFRLARYSLMVSTVTLDRARLVDVSFNLARSLCKAGYVQDAVAELEILKEEGVLNVEGLQVYAISLWKLGKKDLALSAAKDLAKCVPTIEKSSAAASICLICTLLYCISGVEAAMHSILKMPEELLQSSKVSFLVSAVDAVSQNDQLQSTVSSSRCCLSSQQEIMEMHQLVALSRLVRNESGHSLNLQSGINHLKKALHMYPSNTPVRNMLGYCLFSQEQWNNNHIVRRCVALVPYESSTTEGLRSVQEVVGAEAVACNSVAHYKVECPRSTCKYQQMQGISSMKTMQRWLRLEPWNHNARYLLVLVLMQRAREARYPQHLINVLKRINLTALTSQSYLKESTIDNYKRFLLLLCSSELSFLGGDTMSCIAYAKEASNLSLSDGYAFFSHLQLCRVHAAKADYTGCSEEFMQCLKLKTDIPVGWLSLKLIESRYQPQNDANSIDFYIRESVKESKESWSSWMPVYNMICGLIAYWAQDFVSAERFLAEACELAASESCFFLCHGAICMELVKRQFGSQYLTMGIRSLKKAPALSSTLLPLAHLLLAQAEGNLESNMKWAKNIRLEWSSWLAEERPAELYFQMYLLANHGPEVASAQVDCHQDALSWLLRAIHLNPSCSRYWRTLSKLAESEFHN